MSTASSAFAQDRAGPLAKDEVAIFRSDSSIQCKTGSGISIERMVADLKGLGVAVLRSAQRTLPGGIEPTCGAPSIGVNYFVIKKKDIPRLNLDPTTSGGFRVWSFGMSTTWIRKFASPDACGSAAKPIGKVAAELLDLNVIPVAWHLQIRGSDTLKICTALQGYAYLFETVGNLPRYSSGFATMLPSQGPECRGLVAPVSPANRRSGYVPPQSKHLILPPDDPPASLRGQRMQVTFFVADDGILDSVYTNPVIPPGGFRNRFSGILAGYRFDAAKLNGCRVAGTATLPITFGSR